MQSCSACGKSFSRGDSLKRHVSTVHGQSGGHYSNIGPSDNSKAIIIPEETINRFNKDNTEFDNLDHELNEIINSSLDDYAKWQLIKQLSSKFIDFAKIGPAKLYLEEEIKSDAKEN